MRGTFESVVVVAVLTTGFICPTHVDAGQTSHSSSTHEKVYTAEDFRKSAVNRGPNLEANPLWVEIARGLPPYRLQFIPDKGTASSDAGSSERFRHVGRIVISRRGSAAAIQTIELESHLPASDVMKWFDAKDINFDSYLDLAVPFDSGAKWMSFTYWCFDKSKGRFATSVLSDELREVRANSIELDPQVDEIHAWHLGSDCPGLHEIFKIVDGHLVLERDEKYAPEGNGCILSIEKRIEGKMAVVETRAVPAAEKAPH
jgi:hypothetical protein